MIPPHLQALYGSTPQTFVSAFVRQHKQAVRTLLQRVSNRTGIEHWTVTKPGDPTRRLRVRMTPSSRDPTAATALQLVCWALATPQFLRDEANRLLIGLPVGLENDEEDFAIDYDKHPARGQLAGVDPVVTPALAAVLITAIAAVIIVAVIVLPTLLEWGSYAVMEEDYWRAQEMGIQTGGGDPTDAANVGGTLLSGGLSMLAPVGAVARGVLPSGGDAPNSEPKEDAGMVDLRPDAGIPMPLLLGAAAVAALVLLKR